MFRPNLKSVALSGPEIIGGTLKSWAVPGYAYAPFSPKFLMAFCSDGPCECIETSRDRDRSRDFNIPEIH